MPRLGLGMPITAGLSQEAVTTIDDFFFESNASGEVNPILTTSRTNLITYSDNFGHASWAKNHLTATSSIASPVSSASFLIEETTYSTAVPGLQLQSGISVSAGTYTASFYVKNNSGRYLGVSFGTSSERIRTNFDFNTETFKTAIFTGSTTGSVSFEKDGDFYRISVKATFPSTVAAVLVFIPLATDTYPYYANQNSDNRSFYISGAQIEQDSFASAYIPTSGSAVTVSTTLNDTSEVWDFDGADITLEADPEDEGFWEEGSNLVLNHDYAELSDNFVEVPGFETTYTSNQWLAFSSPSTLEISTEQAHEGSSSLKIAGTDGKGVQASATQFSSDYSVNDVVEITAYVYPTISPDNRIKTGVNNSDRSITTLFTGLTLNQWNKIQYQVTISTASNNYISFLNSGTGEFYLDNVSARVVDPNNRWTLGTGWSIEDGVLTSDGTATNATQSIGITAGSTYEVTFTISSYTSGAVRITLNNSGDSGSNTSDISSAGTYTAYLTVGTITSGNLIIDPRSNFVGSVDNVTVREYAVQPKDI